MGMSLGSRKGPQASINMTPMIDVLLVLIIIFMVITPRKSHGLNALVPQPATSESTQSESNDVVVNINEDHTLSINQKPVQLGELPGQLRRLFLDHPGHPLFVRGAKTLEFQQVAEVIDIARGAGVERIALMTN